MFPYEIVIKGQEKIYSYTDEHPSEQTQYINFREKTKVIKIMHRNAHLHADFDRIMSLKEHIAKRYNTSSFEVKDIKVKWIDFYILED